MPPKKEPTMQINMVSITNNVQNLYMAPTGNETSPPGDVANPETRANPGGSSHPKSGTTDPPPPIGATGKERSTPGDIARQGRRTIAGGSSSQKSQTIDRPPSIGYIFRPDDIQCLQILCNWIDRGDLHPEVKTCPDLYERHPQELYDGMASNGNGDGRMYFLYEEGMEGPKRKTVPTNGGYWNPRRWENVYGSGEIVGQKSYLEYCEKKNFVEAAWLMIEYRLLPQEGSNQLHKPKRVLAVVYSNHNGIGSNGEQILANEHSEYINTVPIFNESTTSPSGNLHNESSMGTWSWDPLLGGVPRDKGPD